MLALEVKIAMLDQHSNTPSRLYPQIQAAFILCVSGSYCCGTLLSNEGFDFVEIPDGDSFTKFDGLRKFSVCDPSPYRAFRYS
jgi:hypothetical protein